MGRWRRRSGASELEARERRSRVLLERKVRPAAEMAAAVQTLGADSRVRIEENVKLRVLAERRRVELENVRRSSTRGAQGGGDDDEGRKTAASETTRGEYHGEGSAVADGAAAAAVAWRRRRGAEAATTSRAHGCAVQRVRWDWTSLTTATSLAASHPPCAARRHVHCLRPTRSPTSSPTRSRASLRRAARRQVHIARRRLAPLLHRQAPSRLYSRNRRYRRSSARCALPLPTSGGK